LGSDVILLVSFACSTVGVVEDAPVNARSAAVFLAPASGLETGIAVAIEAFGFSDVVVGTITVPGTRDFGGSTPLKKSPTHVPYLAFKFLIWAGRAIRGR